MLQFLLLFIINNYSRIIHWQWIAQIITDYIISWDIYLVLQSIVTGVCHWYLGTEGNSTHDLQISSVYLYTEDYRIKGPVFFFTTTKNISRSETNSPNVSSKFDVTSDIIGTIAQETLLPAADKIFRINDVFVFWIWFILRFGSPVYCFLS